MNILISRREELATGASGVAATAAAAAHAAGEHTMSQTSVTSRTIPVEHIRIASARPFAEVRRKLEDSVPQLDPSYRRGPEPGRSEARAGTRRERAEAVDLPRARAWRLVANRRRQAKRRAI